MHKSNPTQQPRRYAFPLASFWPFLPAPRCTSGSVCSSCHPCSLWSFGSTCTAARNHADGTQNLRMAGAMMYHHRSWRLMWLLLRCHRQRHLWTLNQRSQPDAVRAARPTGQPHKAAVPLRESCAGRAAGAGILSKRNTKYQVRACARGPRPVCSPIRPRWCHPPRGH